MLGRETDRVNETFQNYTRGNRASATLQWDPTAKTVRQVGGADPDSSDLSLTRKDMGFARDRR